MSAAAEVALRSINRNAGCIAMASHCRHVMPTPQPTAPGKPAPTLLAVVVGAAAWAAFAFWLHAAWIGVAPIARG